MSTVLIHGLTDRIEAIPAWPEGPFGWRDYPTLYSAARPQIEHLKNYAKALGKLRGLGGCAQVLLDSWADEFFKIDAYRSQITWLRSVTAANVAIEICYAHVTIPLQGENFRIEMARIRAQAGV
jgi:hypothetical protein